MGARPAILWLLARFTAVFAEHLSNVTLSSYNVPEFGPYDVPLGAVLEYVYQTYVLKRPSPVLEATVVVVQRAIPLPEAVP